VWWDWSHEQLRRALPDFRALAIEDFLEKYEDETPRVSRQPHQRLAHALQN